MEAKSNLNWETVKAVLPTSFHVYFVDRNENFDDLHTEMQESIHQNQMDPLFDKLDNESGPPDVSYELDRCIDSIKSAYPALEVNEIVEQFKQEIYDHIHEHDQSTPFVDMLRNTSKQTMFYDLGHEVPADSYRWTDYEMRVQVNAVRNLLYIKHHNYDSQIEEMLRQASYGGSLVIYFYEDFDDFICDESNDFKTIIFNGVVNLAVINTGNGSGGDCVIALDRRCIPFDRKKVFLDKTFKYNWTFSVCGMSANWCQTTHVELSHRNYSRKTKTNDEKTGMQQQAEKESMYEKTFKEGRCTWGDQNFKRHRDVYYVNSYPCGNKCPHCGQFWID